MASNELIWRIAGGSGDGIDSTSQNFAKALMRSGLHVFTHRHYPSRIRGGHTFTEVRAAADEVRSRGDGFNFLLALGDSFARSQESEDAYYGNEEIKPLTENLDDLREGGVICYDEGVIDIDEVEDFEARVEANNWHVYPLNLREIARDEGQEIMRNSAGVGATAALVGIEPAEIEELMRDEMSEDVLEQNLTILERAAAEVRDRHAFTHDLDVPSGEHDEPQVLVTGSHAIAYAAIDEGCRFISGYPMTPWTDVFTIMSQLMPELGGIAEQVEDEIAAATLAIGATHTGVKAMTGSSGGGFALMSESLGMAEMVEEPLVMLEAQRAGPSTGMPTKPEQGDLEHVLYTSQGDSNRVVLAPGNHEEAYDQTRLAFQVAYETNMPTILLYDQKLAGEFRNVPMDFFDREPTPDEPATLDEADIEEFEHHSSGEYLRYKADTGDAVARRTVPGQSAGRFLATGNEHNVAGHISEDPENRVRQVERRLDKLETARAVLDDHVATVQSTHGPEDAELGILTWGTNEGTVAEAVDRLNDNGHRTRSLTVGQLAPFPTAEVDAFLESVDQVLVVEMNKTGQFTNHVHRELGAHDHELYSLLKYDGTPFEPAEIVDGLEHRLDGDGETHEAFNTRMEPAGVHA